MLISVEPKGGGLLPPPKREEPWKGPTWKGLMRNVLLSLTSYLAPQENWKTAENNYSYIEKFVDNCYF